MDLWIQIWGPKWSAEFISGLADQAGYTGPAMKRPIGLILSVTVLSLAALFLLLMTALTAFVGHLRRKSAHDRRFAAPCTHLMLAVSVF